MDKTLKKLKELGVESSNIKKITGKKQRPGFIVSIPPDDGWLVDCLSEEFDVRLEVNEDKIVYKIHRKRGDVG